MPINFKLKTATSALMLCLASTCMAQTEPAQIEKPNYKVGDTWVYNSIDGWRNELVGVSVNTISKADSAGYVMDSTEGLDGPTSQVIRDRNFNLMRINGPDFVQLAKPYYPNYAFPLSIGKTWQQSVELAKSTDAGKTIHADLQTRVVGWEMVTVPAGNFMALKIETSGWYEAKVADGHHWRGKITDTLWYSPQARNAVRYEYMDTGYYGERHSHDITELSSYWFAK